MENFIFLCRFRSFKGTENNFTAWKVSVFGVFLFRMQENKDQKNSEYGHFSRSVIIFLISILFRREYE